jgi:site-specific DNA-methyltransferase (adenine-specific)
VNLITKIGRQTVVTGDCLPVMQAMAAASIDVVCTSPPYNINVAYNSHNDRQPRETYLAWLGERFAEIHRVMKPAGSFFLNIGTGTKDDPWLPYDIAAAARAASFVLQNEIAWIKAVETDGVIRGHVKSVNSTKYLDRAHEKILHLTKRGDVDLDRLSIGWPFADKSNIARRNHGQDRRCGTNVWRIGYETVQSKTEKFDHPAGFPVELPLRCIKLHGVRPDLVVLDPFLGAGTTLVAAQELGCRGIGIEIDKQYIDAAIARLKATLSAETPHSRIGPSSAALVWHCAGSVQAQDAVGRPEAGEAADRGTGLHAYAEALLRDGKKLPADTPPEVVQYISEVRRIAAAAGVVPLVEYQLDLSAYHLELYGTADAVIIDLVQGVLTVGDLKTGAHQVPADALQLRLYGSMTYMTLPPADAQRIRHIDTVVVQPNGSGDPIRRARHRVSDILNTLSEYVDRAHVATGSADPPRTVGPWCREYFCAARSSCPEFKVMVTREAQAEFTAAAKGGDRTG